MIKIAYVEDDSGTTNIIANCLDRYAEEKKTELHYTHFDRAEELLESYSPQYDLIFFDIMLVDGITGMEAAAKLRKLDESVQIIFITSLAQYAVKSYEVGALDFVLKPFSYYQLAMKLDRAIHVITRDAGLSIPVNTATGIRILSDRDITFLEVFDHDLIYHTDRETFRTRESLSKKEKELEGRPFVRVSVSHLVNLRYVSEIDGNTLKLTTGDRITISRSRKKSVMGALAKYLGGNL